jgi:hypothetical protein
MWGVIESQESVAVSCRLDPNLPQVVSPSEFLQVLFWDAINAFDEPQYPRYSLGVFVGQGIKKFLDRASAIIGSIELD